jgi:hypothetical protein
MPYTLSWHVARKGHQDILQGFGGEERKKEIPLGSHERGRMDNIKIDLKRKRLGWHELWL